MTSRTRKFRNLAVVASIGALACISFVSALPSRAAETSALQTVAVAVQPDGTIQSITGHLLEVGTTTSGSETTYDPSKVAADLPVRLRTAYVTKDSTGTNLADLEGYSGPLTIELTVENLTVSAKNIAYDLSGIQRNRTALVGLPMTVVASTTIDTEPGTVITASTDPNTVTNGVLSRTGDGDAVVQWATVLAPPSSWSQRPVETGA